MSERSATKLPLNSKRPPAEAAKAKATILLLLRKFYSITNWASIGYIIVLISKVLYDVEFVFKCQALNVIFFTFCGSAYCGCVFKDLLWVSFSTSSALSVLCALFCDPVSLSACCPQGNRPVFPQGVESSQPVMSLRRSHSQTHPVESHLLLTSDLHLPTGEAPFSHWQFSESDWL